MNLFNYTEWSYRTFLDEKSVVIIGGSEDARIPERGEFDVVVRVNSHVIRQGGRCDVLYHTAIPCLTVDLLESFQNDPAFVFLNLVDSDFESGARAFPFYLDFLCELRAEFPSTDVGFFTQGEWMFENPFGKEYEWLNGLHKRYKAKLFTGLVALAHILRFSPRSVEVRGMNVYTNKTKGERVRRVESHELDGNLAFLCDARKDSRVVFDEILQEALKLYGV